MAVTITPTSNPAGVGSAASVTVYTSATLGAESVDRLIAILIGKEVATIVPSAVSLGGQTAELADGTTFGNMGAWIYLKSFPTGSNADVSITWTGTISAAANHIALYALTGAAAPPASGNDTSTDMDTTSPLTSGNVTVSTDGGMLALAVGATDTVAKTWAGITEGLDVDAGDFRFTTAITVTAATASRTCTGGTNGEDGVMAWVNFANSVIPNLNMPPYTPPGK